MGGHAEHGARRLLTNVETHTKAGSNLDGSTGRPNVLILFFLKIHTRENMACQRDEGKRHDTKSRGRLQFEIPIWLAADERE
jgi:hypothetical protein